MLKKSGIYKITNLINDKIYVGSSVDLRGRKKEHIHQLKNNKHHNIHLQRAYNEYGEENFKWEILEYVERLEDTQEFKRILLERENNITLIYINPMIQKRDIIYVN